MQLMWISSKTGDIREVKITPIKMFLVTLVGAAVAVLFCSLILFLAGLRISIEWRPEPLNRSEEKNSRNQNITPEVPVELTSLVDYRLSISRYLENSGKYQNIEGNGLIEHFCSVVKIDENRYCTSISMAETNQENGKEYVYAVESGYPLNDDYTIASYHAAGGGLLTFYKFQVLDGTKNLKLIAKSAPTFCGAFGTPCASVLYQVGAGPELGWKVESGDMHQGRSGSHLGLFAELDGKIKSILTMQTSYNNTNVGSTDETEPIEEIDATASLRLPAKAIFSDIEVNISGVRTVKGKKMDLSKTYTLKFDSNAGRYESKPVDDFFGDREY